MGLLPRSNKNLDSRSGRISKRLFCFWKDRLLPKKTSSCRFQHHPTNAELSRHRYRIRCLRSKSPICEIRSWSFKSLFIRNYPSQGQFQDHLQSTPLSLRQQKSLALQYQQSRLDMASYQCISNCKLRQLWSAVVRHSSVNTIAEWQFIPFLQQQRTTEDLSAD